VEEYEGCRYFEAVTDTLVAQGMEAAPAAVETAKILLNQGAQLANEHGVGWHQIGVVPAQMAQVLQLRVEGRIGPQSVLPLLRLATAEEGKIELLAQEHDLLLLRDEGLMEQWIMGAIAAEPKAAEDVSTGKDAAMGRLLGHIMKVSRGQADAQEVSRLLKDKLRP
jgi:aspartyl-tRNA(Asn)/glutamyl-tRNA(Gln) amidotransferase subunit B